MCERPTDSDSNIEGGIAIVGMACRAPGVHGVDEYWNLSMEGSPSAGPSTSNIRHHADAGIQRQANVR